MARPSPAIIGSVALHLGVAALALFSWPQKPPRPVTSAVPVSIVSEDVVIRAAPADNPSEELITEDAATSPPPPPVETPPTPTPTPTPTPRPAPTPTRPAPSPRPVPPRTQPQPAPRPAQPTPTPRREEPSLDLNNLAGDRRNPGTRGNQRATGQQDSGTAPRAVGRADLQALGRQITPHWIFNCDLPGADELEIRVIVRLSAEGRVVGTPRIQRPRSDAAFRAVSDSMLRAIRAAAPFDMPSGYQEQDIPFSFRTATQCGNR